MDTKSTSPSNIQFPSLVCMKINIYVLREDKKIINFKGKRTKIEVLNMIQIIWE